MAFSKAAFGPGFMSSKVITRSLAKDAELIRITDSKLIKISLILVYISPPIINAISKNSNSYLH